MIGIIGAMDEEIAHFKGKLANQSEETIAGLTFLQGEWQGRNVVITKCGVGKVNASIATQKLIDRYHVSEILFTGVAGACNPSLNIGDMVISSVCQQHDIDASPLGFPKGTIPMFDGPSIFEADTKLVERVSSIASGVTDTNVIVGKVVSGDQFIASRETVEELHNDFGADCVEMEGAAVAQVAFVHNVPFVILRSISDKANGDAPADFTSWVTESAKRAALIVDHYLQAE
ncbi:5'-methylthioadenosine/adenosylhomocysteine nucleosidase [Paenalkalicoccus suaedae]|uniref:adenosylhomocysteine nucleosidase n=1 Tax=Paenalkalicoccus suaedae TaxID=2592382 RepID=A0A859FG48_9BACI|nr:5'-methylthioadenosine/adenosylhomocysteine nucleosidase [Paenalkalicoccus suaedae]QKS72077.1 5'-methylthioadenosine/adenosylhomocysteine nucleosidase [Paenalkalicoccus suaedae]